MSALTAIRVTVVRTVGSAPREPGAAMLVWPDRIAGTIGGGALEWAAMAEAREMLAQGRTGGERTYPLGPALGQCCGGAVTLLFEAADSLPDHPRQPLWIWGAGHVGLALAAVLAPLPDFAITWADIAPDRFPDAAPPDVTVLPAADLPLLAGHAPHAAHHLIVTHSHEIDLALCHALLTRGFAGCGLIGSATKWARFRARLQALGHSPAEIARIACPIGDPRLGKHPQAIAVGVAAALLTNPGTAARRGDRAG